MARRFRGKFSPRPDADPQGYAWHGPKGRPDPQGYPGVAPDRLPDPAPRAALAGRPGWLLVAAFPFLFNAFGDGPLVMARALGAFATLGLGAWLLREGLKAEAAWEARKVARRPLFPRKAFGAALIAAGLALGATAPELGIPGMAVVALIGAVLTLAAFGFDPMRDKGMEGIDPFQQDRVAKVVAEGEAHLDALRAAIARLDDGALSARTEAFAATARALFRAVEEDPGDLSAARRYMTVYLQGARDAGAKLADLWARSPDAKARADFEALLDDLQLNFTARTKSLLEDGREGLEIEIEVLRERLAREGLAAASSKPAN